MKSRNLNSKHFFVVLLVIAMTAGCGGSQPKRPKLKPAESLATANPHQQGEAIARLISTGARTMTLQLGEETRTIISMNAEQLDETGTIQDELLEYLGKIDALVLDIRSNKMTNDVLAEIATLPNLKGLLPGSPNITDEGLAQLADCKSLENLDLSYCASVTEAGLGKLASLQSLKSLVLAGPQFDDGVFEQLAKYPALNSLQIDDTAVTDRGCSGLSKLKNLTELRILGRKLTSGAAEHIGKLKLQKLALVGTKIEDAGVEKLVGLADLTDLSLSGSGKITDAGLASIAKMTKLKRLNLRFCGELTSAGMVHLENLNELAYAGVKMALKGKVKLEQLYLSGNALTDESMPAVGELTRLKILVLARNSITAGGVKNFAGLRQLEELTLSNAKLDAESVGIIGQLLELKMLSLGATGLDDAGIANLVKLKKLERLIIPNTPVSDKGLAELFDLQGLKLIYAPGSRITEVGVLSHRARNPQCMIRLQR
jgi:F-box/leucine-rich repeat protein 14